MPLIDWILLCLVIISAGYYLACIASAERHYRRRPAPMPDESLPAITVLKPLRGYDAGSARSFASFCRQDYPKWQVVFGSLDPKDPALDEAERIRRQFAEVDVQIVRGGSAEGTNRKVANLVNMLPAASHPVVILSDSDTRVRPDYLRRIAASFQDPEVGMVTCPYRGADATGLGALAEAFWISAGFIPGVLVAARGGRTNFGMGPTIALRREVLEEIGGLESVADYLADDFHLGQRVVRAGYRVVLSDYIVESIFPREGLVSALARQLRWARTIRLCRPMGHLGLMFTHGVALSSMLLVATGFTRLGWLTLAVVAALQMASLSYVAVRVMGDRVLRRFWWLLPLWDLLGFVIWLVSLFGDTVAWRGQRFRLHADGKMEPLTRTHR